MSVKTLIKEEIDKFPENIAEEIFDFMKYKKEQINKEELLKGSQKISENSLNRIWNNEEDSAYDDF